MRQDQAPSLYIKCEYGIPSQGMGSHEIVPASGTDGGPTARELLFSPSFTTVSCTWKNQFSSTAVLSLFMSFYELRSAVAAEFSIMILISLVYVFSISSLGLDSRVQPGVLLWILASGSINYWKTILASLDKEDSL